MHVVRHACDVQNALPIRVVAHLGILIDREIKKVRFFNLADMSVALGPERPTIQTDFPVQKQKPAAMNATGCLVGMSQLTECVSTMAGAFFILWGEDQPFCRSAISWFRSPLRRSSIAPISLRSDFTIEIPSTCMSMNLPLLAATTNTTSNGE